MKWSCFFVLSTALALLRAHAADVTFSNAASVIIGDSNSLPPIKGIPYPTSIQVTGLAGLVTSRATVTLHGLSHQFPSDIYMLLVDPTGRCSILMAEVGGQVKFSVTNLTITLDDSAAQSLPISSALTSGTFKPTARDLPLSFDFPAPAPPGNSNSPCSLSGFRNLDPSGTWSLYAVDDGQGDWGTLSGGWSLTLSVAPPLQIVRSQTNFIVSWPTTAQTCSLQSASSASAVNWSNVITVPARQSGRWYVTNPIAGPIRFYRLGQ